jgi:integrase
MKSSPNHDGCCGPTDLSRCCRPELKFHALRHTYASLCINAGIQPIAIAKLMGHRDVKTTLSVYAHLINTDDHAGNMEALGAMANTGPTYGGNAVPLRG